MTDWLLNCHAQMCYYYYCYLTILGANTEPGEWWRVGSEKAQRCPPIGVVVVEAPGELAVSSTAA